MRILKRLFSAVIMLFIWQPLHAQNLSGSKYIDVSYIKPNSSVYLNLELNVWKPVNQQLIEEGKKEGWYLYKVKYPVGTTTDYSFVVVNVFSTWSQLEDLHADFDSMLKKVDPSYNSKDLFAKTEAARQVVWRQLFELQGIAVEGLSVPSKYVIVNEMKVVEGESSSYVNLEQKYFKPFHTERAKAGIMQNWSLYRRSMPYGTKFESDYVTFNGYLEWEDITKQNPQGIWKKVHGNVDFNEIHDSILSKRLTVNNEMWELVDFIIK